MTSPAKIAANRRNAQKSTGPKTAAGKARSAQNARKHGLCVSVWRDPEMRREIENFAAVLAGEGAGPRRREDATRVAATHLAVLRARETRNQILSMQSDMKEIVDRLWAVQRHHEEAFGKRKSAIRRYDRGSDFPRTNPTGREWPNSPPNSSLNEAKDQENGSGRISAEPSQGNRSLPEQSE
jgi:hypothetical protein